MNTADIIITSLDDISAFDVVTGAYLFTLDELQSTSIAQSQDETEITGKQGRRLATLKRNKAVTISGTNGILSTGLMSLQTGSTLEETVTSVMWSDYLTVTSNAAATSYIAVGTEGAEIIDLYLVNADGTLGQQFTQAASVSAGKFTYNPSTKALAFNSGDIEDGAEILVHYNRSINAGVLDNYSDTYSGKCKLIINATGEDRCANIYHIQINVPKADFNGNFSIEMGDNQAVHAFEASSLSNACGSAAKFFSYIVFGANAEDVTD